MRLECGFLLRLLTHVRTDIWLYSDSQRICESSWSYTFFESLAVDLACVFDGEFYSLGANIFG